MAGTTSRLTIPYPTGQDRVMDGDNAMQSIAETLDDLQKTGIPFRMAAGQVSLTFAAATQAQAAVTFPAGRFTQSPIVVTGVFIGPATPGYWLRTTGSISTSSFNIVGNLAASGSVTITVWWIAVQMLPGAGGG